MINFPHRKNNVFCFDPNGPEFTVSVLAQNFHFGASLSLTLSLLELIQSHGYDLSTENPDG